MNARLPWYEGDGFIRQAAEAEAKLSGDVATDADDLEEIERKARALRGDAFASFLKRIAEWVEGAASRAHERDVEAYLAQSTDHADLEHRLQHLQRKGLPGYL